MSINPFLKCCQTFISPSIPFYEEEPSFRHILSGPFFYHSYIDTSPPPLCPSPNMPHNTQYYHFFTPSHLQRLSTSSTPTRPSSGTTRPATCSRMSPQVAPESQGLLRRTKKCDCACVGIDRGDPSRMARLSSRALYRGARPASG